MHQRNLYHFCMRLLFVSIWPLAAFGDTGESLQFGVVGDPATEPCSKRYNMKPNWLAESATSNVYKAYTIESNELVIIKVFKKAIYYEREENIYKELDRRISDGAAAAAEPSWTHFVRLLHRCNFNGRQSLVIEFLEMILSEIIALVIIDPDSDSSDANAPPDTMAAAVIPMEPPRIAETVGKYKWYAYQLLEAVEVQHGLGIFHLDLKPENIGLTGDGTLKLFDFEHSATQISANRQHVGTKEFQAPEMNLGLFNQIQDSGQGHKVDIWAVGCIIYEIFTENTFSEAIRKFSKCPAKQSPTTAVHCANRAAYFYLKWSFGAITPEMYKAEEKRAHEDCPAIFSKECIDILESESPSIFAFVNIKESVSNTPESEFNRKMNQITLDASQKEERLYPSSTEPEELIKLLTDLLKLDFNDRITAHQARTQYRMFDTIKDKILR